MQRVLRDEARWIALGAAAGHHPREHLGAIGRAAQEQRIGAPRLCVRQRRRANRERQRPHEHPLDGKPEIAAPQTVEHERKARERIEDGHERGDADDPPEGVREKCGDDQQCADHYLRRRSNIHHRGHEGHRGKHLSVPVQEDFTSVSSVFSVVERFFE